MYFAFDKSSVKELVKKNSKNEDNYYKYLLSNFQTGYSFTLGFLT